MSKTALITGITGQDGYYLAKLLSGKGYRVVGMVRHLPHATRSGLQRICSGIELRQGDLLDSSSLITLLEESQPDEIYNLAAFSFVPTSWSQPVLTAELNGLGVCRLLEAVRLVNRQIKFFQASSSEMFGGASISPQDEKTPFHPRSPYAVAKAYGHFLTVSYRESYDLFACGGILFNHESPRRGEEFVTRKITSAAARIKLGLQSTLRLGNLESSRDWGFAGDSVRAMWLTLQQESPGDYVIGTGQAHTVAQFAEAAFRHLGLNWRDHVIFDPLLARSEPTSGAVADPSKARQLLGWRPRISFDEMVRQMVEADLALISQSG
ncbi:MAG: GDP-mannose 4,6-dehydratase [Acidobacteriota bacterium]